MNLNEYHLFSNNKNSLKEISKDDSKIHSGGEIEYLSKSSKFAIDFDRVKSCYFKEKDLLETYSASVDALFQSQDGKLYFVEFKNGTIDGDNITRKAKDSLFIFMDVTRTKFYEIRSDLSFLLVVNDATIDNLNYKDKKALSLARLGKADFAIYGLSKLRTFCYGKVNMMKASEFDTKIDELLGNYISK